MEIVTAPSWSDLTYRRPLTLLTTEYCWIDSTLILALTVLPSRGFAPTFPTDLNTLSLAITLPSLLGGLLLAGVPQGSVLGPLLFTTYTSPLSDIVKNFDVSFHQYADDTSLYSVLSNHSVSEQLDNLRKCTDAINDWNLVNFLQANPQKSEVMFIGTPTHLKNLSPPSSINNAGTTLPSSSTTLQLLGVTFDSQLSFKPHAISVIKSCNHLIWAIRHIRPFLSVDITSALARSLVLSRLDYCNSLLYNLCLTYPLPSAHPK